MRSIERRFNKLKSLKQNEYKSSYTLFAEAIKGQKFGADVISRKFGKLVDKSDYSSSEKKSVLRYLTNLSNPPQDNRFYQVRQS